MQNLQNYLIFASAAKWCSFAQAAREHGLTPSTVAKAIQRLERDLGVRLFHRTTRQVSLTREGEAVLANCRRLLAEFENLQASAAGARGAPQGLLRISIPLAYGRQMILPVLANLVRRHPQIELDVQLTDQYCDLVRDGFDAAIRTGEQHDSTLVARRIGSQQLILCASPDYLAAHGTPGTLNDLHAHQAIVFRMPTSGRDRPWMLRDRQRVAELRPARASLRFNDGEAMAAAACEGLGIAQLPHYMVDAALLDGRLVELLPTRRPPAMDIVVCYPSGRQLSPRVRALVDALVDARLDGSSPPQRHQLAQGRSRRAPSGK